MMMKKKLFFFGSPQFALCFFVGREKRMWMSVFCELLGMCFITLYSIYFSSASLCWIFFSFMLIFICKWFKGILHVENIFFSFVYAKDLLVYVRMCLKGCLMMEMFLYYSTNFNMNPRYAPTWKNVHKTIAINSILFQGRI